MNLQVRLNKENIDIIKNIVLKTFGKSEIYIFGSRIDMNKKGGDIDIFIIPENRDNLFDKKIKTKMELEERLLIPIDIVIHKNFDYEIEKQALKGYKICAE